PEQVLSNWRKTPTWMAPHAKYVAVYKTDLLHARQLSGNAGSRVGPMVEIHDVSEPDSDKTAIFRFYWRTGKIEMDGQRSGAQRPLPGAARTLIWTGRGRTRS